MRLILVAVALAYTPATRDTPPLYRVGEIVRAGCDGGDDTTYLSVYASPSAVLRVFDANVPLPKARWRVRAGTPLRVVGVSRHQLYTPVSHATYLNLQILRVTPLSGASWHGYVQSIDVEPASGPREASVCIGG